MNPIRCVRRSLAPLTGPPRTPKPRASQPTAPAAPPAGRPGHGSFAGRFLQDVAAAASVAAGHQLGRRGRGGQPAGGGRWAARPPSAPPPTAPAERNWPPTTATMPRRRTMIGPGLLPRTVQLCIHCRQRPAGFWVSRTGGQTVRRPWCLSCCQELDRDLCDVVPFGS